MGSRSDTLISPEDQAKRIRSYANAHGIDVELDIKRGSTTPIRPVDWDNLPVSVRLASAEDI